MTALQAIARMSAESLLNCMLEGLAIALFAWILLRLTGRRNSSTRFAVWFFALLAIATLPVLNVAAASARASASAIAIPSSWALDIFFLWAAIAALGMLRVGVGLFQLHKLRKNCSEIDPGTLDPALRSILKEFQLIRPVTLLQSDRVRVPAAIGFLNPVVIIPTWALHELSTTELNSILIHELAHLRRHDDWTNLAQQILKALLFFHPAVWWIENQLALEREMACDDAVLAQTTNPRAYAQCLVSVAEKSFMRRGIALAQAAVNRMRQTSLRVSQILDANRPSATQVWKPALYSVAAFFVVCLISLPRAPELVAFEDRAQDVNIAATPAHETPTLTASANSFERHPTATPVVFHPQAANSFAPRMREHGIASHRIEKGTPSVAPKIAQNNSGLQPVREAAAEHATLFNLQFDLPGPDFVQATQTLDRENEVVTSPAIFVLIQNVQYVQPSGTIYVWRVTILDANRITARIPAKQI